MQSRSATPNDGNARANASGGSAAAGGMNLHSRVAAVAGVHLICQQRLSWLKGREIDLPGEVLCETNGPGDDIRLVLTNGQIVEMQVKKGLSRGLALWDSMLSLAHGTGSSYGVLVVDAAASATIREDLAQGIERLAQGRADSLSEITTEFKQRLESDGLNVENVCKKLSIRVVHCSDHDDATVQAAKSALRLICASEATAQAAWTTLELAGHKLIESKGRWTKQALLKLLQEAAVDLIPSPEAPNVAPECGLAWQRLNEYSENRGYIENFRQYYLLSEQTGASPFGGRDRELIQLDTWLQDSGAPSRYLVCAPTARGKSALLVRWTERLASDGTWVTVFVPISLRFGTDRPAIFYALLATQLAVALGDPLAPPPADAQAFYQGKVAALLQQAAQQGRHLLVVLDGLDEAQGEGFNPTVIPAVLPSCVRVLASAREQALDRGHEGWLRRLEWQGSSRAASLSLSALDHHSVPAILQSAGIPKASVSDELARRLAQLSCGEPLLLRLYAEDLAEVFRTSGAISITSLNELQSGFHAYFSRCFNVSSFTDQTVSQAVVDTTLAVLASALGPLERTTLTELVCKLSGTSRPAVTDRFIRPLRRFIAGDGSRSHGFVLNHPKLGEYLREDRIDTEMQRRVETELIQWGRSVARALQQDPSAEAPPYAIRHLVTHLRSATASAGDLQLLLTEGWRKAWFDLDASYAGYSDSLCEASKLLPEGATPSQDFELIRARVRLALVVSSVHSQSSSVPSDLLALALDHELITKPQAVRLANLQQKDSQSQYLTAIAGHLTEDDLESLRRDILRVPDPGNRVSMLARLVPHFPTPRREQIAEEVLADVGDLEHVAHRIDAVLSILPAMNSAPLEEELSEWLTCRISEEHLPGVVTTLARMLPSLLFRGESDLAKRVSEQCSRWIEAIRDSAGVLNAVAAICEHMDANWVAGQLQRVTVEITAAATAQRRRAPLEPGNFMGELRAEGALISEAMLWLLQLRSVPTDQYRSAVTTRLESLLGPGFWQVNAMIRLLPLVRSDAREALVERVFQLASLLPTANNRTHALTALAKTASKGAAKRIVERAWLDARRIEDEYARGLALVSLFATLPAESRELELGRVLADVHQIRYALRLGELQLRLSALTPSASKLAVVGIANVLRANDTHNAVTTLLRELKISVPAPLRLQVFEQLWSRMLSRRDVFSVFQFQFAASIAPEFWTLEKLEAVLPDLKKPSPHNIPTLVDFLPIAERLGKQDLVVEALNQLSSMPDPAQRLPYVVGAARGRPSDARFMRLLYATWISALTSTGEQVVALVDGLEVLHRGQWQPEWQRLKGRIRDSAQPVQIARLSLFAETDAERIELQECALELCAAKAIDQRVSVAAQLATMLETPQFKSRALELMTRAPAVPRTTVLSALGQVAAVLASSCPTTAVLGSMNDVRECAVWWP